MSLYGIIFTKRIKMFFSKNGLLNKVYKGDCLDIMLNIPDMKVKNSFLIFIKKPPVFMNFNTVRKSIIMLINAAYIFCVSLFFLNYDIIWHNRYFVNNQLILTILWLIATAMLITVNAINMKISEK